MCEPCKFVGTAMQNVIANVIYGLSVQQGRQQDLLGGSAALANHSVVVSLRAVVVVNCWLFGELRL